MKKTFLILKNNLEKNDCTTYIKPFIHAYRFTRWMLAGKPVPIPQFLKRKIICEYAMKYKLPVFIETGTYQGDTVDYMKNYSQDIYSIELDYDLYKKARARFYNSEHIKIIHGDSGKQLGEILSKIQSPCLFWLDGHYSGEGTAKGEFDTPIIRELETICNHSCKLDHVILIDDAREFNGSKDYPTLNFLTEFVLSKGFSYFKVQDDVIRIHH